MNHGIRPPQDLKLLMTQQRCGQLLDQARSMFIPGTKIALLVLPPGGVNGNLDFVMMDMPIGDAMAMLGRAQVAQAGAAVPAKKPAPSVTVAAKKPKKKGKRRGNS